MNRDALRSVLWSVVIAAGLSLASVAHAQAPAAPAQAPRAAARSNHTPPAPRTPESAVTPEIKNIERHHEFMARKDEGKLDLLFLGDSITDFWPKRGEWTWLEMAHYNPADFGISGDRTEHVLWRIENGELDGIHPKAVVIMIGTNNVGQCPDEKPEWAANGVKKIVETVHQKLPEAKILLLAVFPRNEKDSDLRHKVDQINEIVSKLDGQDNVTYLDFSKKFLESDGTLSRDIMPDLLHPNAKGYEIWYHEMMPALHKLMQ